MRTGRGSVLLLGNFNAYYIVDRVGTQVIYDPIIRSTGNNRPTGQAGWFGFWRVGAEVADLGQFKRSGCTPRRPRCRWPK